MRMIFGLVLLVGMALAGGAVYLTQGYIAKTEQALAQERAFRAQIGPMVEVFITNKDMKYGDPLTKDDVQKIFWPKNALPEHAFVEEAALFPADTQQPRYVLREMSAFEPVLAKKVTEPGQQAGLTSMLEPGMRAFAIRVDVASGVSGFVNPGDAVDIYWTTTSPEGEVTRMIEQRVSVVAVDQQSGGDRTGEAIVARTVTVQAGPETVARLAQAQATGRLSLALVGADDTAIADAGLIEVDSKALLGITEQEVVEAPAERVCTIRTRRGGELVEIPIACTN
ncbi:MAG: Flp pilus assembly protein CpaB [Pseudomonadota bacterium]|jgi:pilus assembly protein CpaB